MLATLRQRNFALLWFGQLISMLGDWLLFIALPFYIYTLTGSTLATGIMFIVQTLPRVFLGSVAGVFVDRWSRKQVMVITNLIQAVVLLPLLLVHSQSLVWIIYVFAFLESSVSQFFNPAEMAIIPSLVDEQHILSANSLNSMSQELTRLIGPFLGGILMALYGINSVVLIDAFSFLCAAALLIFITVSATPVKEQEKQSIEAIEEQVESKAGNVWREWIEGLRLVGQDKVIVAIFLAFGVAMIGEGIIEVMLAPWVKSLLHGTSLTFGWLASAQAIGGIGGSLLMPRITKVVKPALLISISGVMFGLLIFALVNISIFWIDLLLISVVGAAAIGFYVNIVTLLQNTGSDKYRGRIFGVFGVVQAVTMLLGMGFASLGGDKIGILPVLNVSAICDVAGGLLALLLVRAMSRQVSTVDTEPVVLDEGVEVR